MHHLKLGSEVEKYRLVQVRIVRGPITKLLRIFHSRKKVKLCQKI